MYFINNDLDLAQLNLALHIPSNELGLAKMTFRQNYDTPSGQKQSLYEVRICTVLPLEKNWPDTTAQTDGQGESYLPKNVAVLGCNNQYALMCNYRCVDGVGSRSILRLFIPSTQLDEGVVVEDSTNSFFTPTMQLDEVGIVMHIVESRLLRGEPPPCELHAMFTNLWKSRVGG